MGKYTESSLAKKVSRLHSRDRPRLCLFAVCTAARYAERVDLLMAVSFLGFGGGSVRWSLARISSRMAAILA